MTEIAHRRDKATSIKRHLYLMVGAFAAIAVAIVQFQFWQSEIRDRGREGLVEYHIATLLSIEHINTQLATFQTQYFGGDTDRSSLFGSSDVSNTKAVINSNFAEIAERQRIFGEPAFVETVARAEKRKRAVIERLESLASPGVHSGELIHSEIRYFAEALDQLERLHLNTYQTHTDQVVIDQQDIRTNLFITFSLILVFGAVVVAILMRAITAGLDRQVESDRQLIKLNASLEDKIELRTAELLAAKEQADRANASKSQFLASASHDLRQPVQAITILCYALKAQLQDDDARPLVEKLESNTDVIVDLLNELLDISKLDAGAIEPAFQPVPMEDLLRTIEQSFADGAQQKGVDLRVVPSTAVVHSDAVFLGRILQNLVANAIRYTDAGKILVGCRRQGKHLRIDICDTGRGIDEAHLDRIFEEFYQIDNPARNRRRGMGLGLAIVQRLVRSLGHNLDVSSKVGKGSRFSITVPIEVAQINLAPKAARHDDMTLVEAQCSPY